MSSKNGLSRASMIEYEDDELVRGPIPQPSDEVKGYTRTPTIAAPLTARWGEIFGKKLGAIRAGLIEEPQ